MHISITTLRTVCYLSNANSMKSKQLTCYLDCGLFVYSQFICKQSIGNLLRQRNAFNCICVSSLNYYSISNGINMLYIRVFMNKVHN